MPAEAGFLLSITHGEKELEETLAAADRVFAKMAKMAKMAK